METTAAETMTAKSQRIAMDARKRLSAFIRATEQFEGKHIGRMGEATKEAIREASNAYLVDGDDAFASSENPYIPSPQSTISRHNHGKAPTFTLGEVREYLARAVSMIHLTDWIETHPEIEEYRQLRDRLAEIESAMHKRAVATSHDTRDAIYQQWHRYA